MSKAYKGKTCAYCAAENASTTGDHVFAREFFPELRRANLPKVASCRSCNGNKSNIEHYFTTVLPFAGRHSDASEVLRTMVPRRLEKNRKLHKELSDSLGHAWLRSGGSLAPTATVSLDAEKLHALIRYIVRGLNAYHWNSVIPREYSVGVGLWTGEGEQQVLKWLPQGGKATVEENWGAGAFEYRGIQATDDPHLTIWRLKLYGGALFGGDPALSDEASPRLWAVTSAKPIPDLFEY